MDRLRMTAEKVAAWEEEAMKPGWEDPYSSHSTGQTRQQAFRRTMMTNKS
jgi:hypothetical protein